MKVNVKYIAIICLLFSSSLIANNDFKTDADLVAVVKEHCPTKVAFAESVVQSLYQNQVRRPIKSSDGKNKFGQEFALNPEMLFKLMSDVKGKRVLEIAGARGQNAILLGLAGAEHVYLNDITESEVDFFSHTVSELNDAELESKFTGIKGDYLNLPQRIAPHSLDMVLARNIFHLLKTSQRNDFFRVVKSLLKPNGVLAITANAKQDQFAHLPAEATRFRTATLISAENELLAREVTLCDEDLSPTEYENITLADFLPFGTAIHTENIEALSPSFSNCLQNYLENSGDISGCIRLLKNTSMHFSKANLNTIFTENGFSVLGAHSIGSLGHYMSEAEEIEKKGANFVGIIARLAE